jgi:tripartite ATP-independent periplasmic transporter solute receptor, DctP family
MKMRKLLAGLCVAAVTSWAGAASAQVFIAADVHPAEYPTTASVISMGKKLSEATNGRLNLKMFPSGQMGDENTTLEKTRTGAIDIVRVSMSPVGGVLPEVGVFNMPFIFKDVDHLHAVLDGPIGEELGQKITDSKLGLVFLGWMDAGSRSLITKKPIRNLEEIKGLKIRLQNNPIGLDAFEALGANPVVIPVGDVFSSLQTGVIDAAENNEPTFDSENYVVAGTKFYDRTEHMMVPEMFAFSKVKWEKLSKDDQELIKKLAKEAQTEERTRWAEYTIKSTARLKEQGVEFLDVDRQPFIDATAPVREKHGAAFADLLKRIEEAKK